jgi:predicted alpha/beta superfamily hydrolase
VAEANRKDVDLKRLTADSYLRFIFEELKPFIDERYQPLTSREHTFMMGSSMGGLISLYALCEYTQVLGGVGCLSSHLSMAHVSHRLKSEQWATGFRNYVAQHLPDTNGSLIYMDHGTKDFDKQYSEYQTLLDNVIRSKGWDKEHYRSLVFEGHGHNETCWAQRLDQPLLFLLRK